MAELLLVAGSFSEKEIAKTNTNVKSNMRFFLLESNICRFCPRLFIYVLTLQTQLSRGESFTFHYHLCAYTNPGHVQWVDVRGTCSFCWYMWNYWPPLFKFSFHNDLLSMVSAPYVFNHPIYDINSFVFVFVTYADIRV